MRTVGLIVATLALVGGVALWWNGVGPPESRQPVVSGMEAVPETAEPEPAAPTPTVKQSPLAVQQSSESASGPTEAAPAPSIPQAQAVAPKSPGTSTDLARKDPPSGGTSAATKALVAHSESNLAALEVPARAADSTQPPGLGEPVESPTRFRERPSMTAQLTSQSSHDRIHFALDQHRLEPEAIATLDALVTLLDGADEVLKLVVDGHCDDSGSDQYNQTLSEMRAEVVVDFLQQRGVNVRDVLTRGFGERIPVAPGQDEAARAINRRAEIRVDWVRKIPVQEVSMDRRD